MALRWFCTGGLVLLLSCFCTGSALVLYWYSTGAICVLCWCHTSTVLVLYWYYTETQAVTPWSCTVPALLSDLVRIQPTRLEFGRIDRIRTELDQHSPNLAVCGPSVARSWTGLSRAWPELRRHRPKLHRLRSASAKCCPDLSDYKVDISRLCSLRSDWPNSARIGPSSTWLGPTSANPARIRPVALNCWPTLDNTARPASTKF